MVDELACDPTLHLPQSDSLPFTFEVGDDKVLRVKGTSAFPGELKVQVQYERGRIPRKAMELFSNENRAKRVNQTVDEQQSYARYNAANELVIADDYKAIGKGDFVAKVQLPSDASGKFVIRCTVCNRDQSAVGTQQVELDR